MNSSCYLVTCIFKCVLMFSDIISIINCFVITCNIPCLSDFNTDFVLMNWNITVIFCTRNFIFFLNWCMWRVRFNSASSRCQRDGEHFLYKVILNFIYDLKYQYCMGSFKISLTWRVDACLQKFRLNSFVVSRTAPLYIIYKYISLASLVAGLRGVRRLCVTGSLFSTNLKRQCINLRAPMYWDFSG